MAWVHLKLMSDQFSCGQSVILYKKLASVLDTMWIERVAKMFWPYYPIQRLYSHMDKQLVDKIIMNWWDKFQVYLYVGPIRYWMRKLNLYHLFAFLLWIFLSLWLSSVIFFNWSLPWEKKQLSLTFKWSKPFNPSDPDFPTIVGRQLNQLTVYFYIVLSVGKTP